MMLMVVVVMIAVMVMEVGMVMAVIMAVTVMAEMALIAEGKSWLWRRWSWWCWKWQFNAEEGRRVEGEGGGGRRERRRESPQRTCLSRSSFVVNYVISASRASSQDWPFACHAQQNDCINKNIVKRARETVTSFEKSLFKFSNNNTVNGTLKNSSTSKFVRPSRVAVAVGDTSQFPSPPPCPACTPVKPIFVHFPGQHWLKFAKVQNRIRGSWPRSRRGNSGSLWNQFPELQPITQNIRHLFNFFL